MIQAPSTQPMRKIAVIVTVIAVFTLLEVMQRLSLDLAQYSLSGAASVAEELITGQEERPSSSSNFSEVFGIANATTATYTNKNLPPSDKPPVRETWLSDTNSFTPEDTNTIPRVVNKIYFQKSSGFPRMDGVITNLTIAHRSWIEMNPGYDVRYFDLNKARQYLSQHFHPVFLRAFDCLPAFASKSDLFRIALLYREGGWHSDWKQVCLQKNILEDISAATDFFATYDIWDSNDFFKHKCVQNAFIGSIPQHPIIATMLEMLLTNIQTSHYSQSALDAAGPCLFGRAIKFSEEERNSTVFSTSAGKHAPPYFEWIGNKIVKHKCDGCGLSQDWGDTGNSYIALYKARNFYCQDAASIFVTTGGW